MSSKKLFLTYYGDDFTGSCDVMEALALNGVSTALFLAPPSVEEVAAFRLKQPIGEHADASLQALGVAGISRSLTPEQMDGELPDIFKMISDIPAEFFQYKTCSTFDSSPHIGTIGHATDLAFEFFPCHYIPLLIGAPVLNRFSVFGNLFARVGDVTYRIDRHPTMSRHPVTPMTESDIRLHLAKQTYRHTKLMDIFALEAEEEERNEKFHQLHNESGEFILFDILNDQHLLHAGQLIISHKYETTQLLVGSSGLEYALCSYLQHIGQLKKPPPPPSPGEAGQMIVVAGSAAPSTHRQIEWAILHGFEDIRMKTEAIVHPDQKAAEVQRIEEKAIKALNEGKSIVIYSALGADDPAIARTRQVMETLQIKQTTSELLAGTQGEILKNLLEQTGIRRVAVAGGDTSGYVARALGIYALEILIPIAPGSPLCTAHAKNPAFDGLQIALKGGQNGNPDYFGSVLHGKEG